MKLKSTTISSKKSVYQVSAHSVQPCFHFRGELQRNKQPNKQDNSKGKQVTKNCTFYIDLLLRSTAYNHIIIKMTALQ